MSSHTKTVAIIAVVAMMAVIGVAAVSGVAAADHDTEDDPDCEEDWWEDDDDVCDEWKGEDDGFSDSDDEEDCAWWEDCEEEEETTYGSEDDLACEEPEWWDEDNQCDQWSDTNDGSASSEMYGESDDPDGEINRNYNHPVEDAVFFRWYDGSDWRVDAGPMVCIDTSEAGGVTEVTMYADEYAEYIMDEANSPLWEEYSSEGNIEEQIDKHYAGQFVGLVEGDEVICSGVWENAWGTNDEAPEWVDEDDWNDPDAEDS